MKYLYYTLWQLLKLIRSNDTPATNAMLLISVCQMLNLLTAYFFINFYANVTGAILQKTTIIIICTAIGSMVYLVNYYFLYKKREVLDSKFSKETRKQRTIGRIVLGIYFFGTFFLAFYFGAKFSIGYSHSI